MVPDSGNAVPATTGDAPNGARLTLNGPRRSVRLNYGLVVTNLYCAHSSWATRVTKIERRRRIVAACPIVIVVDTRTAQCAHKRWNVGIFRSNTGIAVRLSVKLSFEHCPQGRCYAGLCLEYSPGRLVSARLASDWGSREHVSARRDRLPGERVDSVDVLRPERAELCGSQLRRPGARRGARFEERGRPRH